MNPHATEFVPVPPWLPNGYPPNGYMPVSPNGYASVHPNGVPLSTNDYQPSLNGIPEAQNGLPGSINDTSESSDAATVETAAGNTDQVVNEQNLDNSSLETTDASGEQEDEAKPQVVNDKSETEESLVAETAVSDDANLVAKESDEHTTVEEKPSKCWGDYSDNEVEIVEVTS